MKQDIRDLFKGDVASKKQLPDNHRQEFYEKLKAKNMKPNKSWLWLKIAAVLILALTVGFLVIPKNSNEVKVSLIIAQIETIEAEYLANIETEWQSFIAIAEDEILIERFRKKLKELDTDYKAISVQFKTDTNNILVIEALVDNLQTRLQILKDIQKHIKILNQKNEPYDNTI